MTPWSALLSVTREGVDEIRTGILGAHSVDDVGKAAANLRLVAGRLHDHGLNARAVTRLITEFNDAVARRLVELLDAGGEFVQANACLIVLGSQGRGEQTLSTDQDNAIVYADHAPAGSRERLVALGGRLNEALAACGYPLCRGNIMSGNPQWCLGLTQWQRAFARWIDHGDPQALLNATVFFDFRAVHGTPEPVLRLRAWLTGYAADHGRFLLQMARNAQANGPPLGLLRDFVVAGSGEHPDTIDLKINGVQPFVEAARIYALADAVPATGTVERLRAIAPARRIGEAERNAWIEAFQFIQRLRVRLNFEQQCAGAALHNHLDPGTLNELDRRILKEAFREAKHLQVRLAQDFAAVGGGFGV